MRILIVDDEPKVRRHLREMLERWPECSQVFEASDGMEALVILEAAHPELVVTDVRMPRMDGLTLLKEIRRQGHRVGQVILSGYGDFSYTQAAMQQGVRNYLLKPVEESQLLEAMRRAQQEMEHDRLLHHQLQRGESARRERALVRLIHGRIPAHPLPEMFSFADGTARLFVLELVADESPDYTDMLERLEAEGRIFATLDETRWVCLSTIDAAPAAEAQYLRDCFATEGSSITVVYGDALTQLHQLGESYQQICRVLESRWLLPDSNIMNTQQLPAAVDADVWQGLKQWNHTALDEAIDHGDQEEIRLQTDRLFKLLKGSRYAEGVMRALFIEEVIHTMRKVLDEGGDAEMVLGEELNISEWLAQRNVVQLQSWYATLCLRVAQYLDQMRTGRPRCVSDQVLTMFREDPSRSWSLSELAATFYMSPVYLGQVFKKETGQSLHACLTNERLRLIKNELQKNDTPVYEIAEKYGYANLRSFYTAFKKNENCTPSEYRERMRKK